MIVDADKQTQRGPITDEQPLIISLQVPAPKEIFTFTIMICRIAGRATITFVHLWSAIANSRASGGSAFRPRFLG
jgi:hypothetical protein